MGRSRLHVVRWLPVFVLAAGSPVAAQTVTPLPEAAVPPLNVLVPNYNGVAVGEIASLEANAYLARANDASATWYNPAGLTLAKQNSVSGSAGAFQRVAVTPEGLRSRGGSFQHLPAMVSIVVKNLFHSQSWAGGVSITQVNNWSQSTEAERNFTAPQASERVTYSSRGDFTGTMFNLAVGYTDSRKLRVGASVDGQLTRAARAQSVSDQAVTATGLNAFLIDSHGSATVFHLRMSLGVQYDVTQAWRVGAMMRTPGLAVFSSGSYAHEGLSSVGPAKASASFFEPAADVRYRLPVEFKAGAAYVGRRAQIEADVLAWSGTGSQFALTSTEPWTIVTDPGNGGDPAVRQVPFVGPVIDAQAVVNVALGGHVDLTSNGAWKAHAGYATNRSPVGPDDTYFAKVHLHAVTAGVSGRAKFVVVSGGIRYEGGETDNISLRPLKGGQPLDTRIKVSNLGVVYSLALLF